MNLVKINALKLEEIKEQQEENAEKIKEQLAVNSAVLKEEIKIISKSCESQAAEPSKQALVSALVSEFVSFSTQQHTVKSRLLEMTIYICARNRKNAQFESS